MAEDKLMSAIGSLVAQERGYLTSILNLINPQTIYEGLMDKLNEGFETDTDHYHIVLSTENNLTLDDFENDKKAAIALYRYLRLTITLLADPQTIYSLSCSELAMRIGTRMIEELLQKSEGFLDWVLPLAVSTQTKKRKIAAAEANPSRK